MTPSSPSPLTEAERLALEAELRRVDARIQDAYWAFTRTARGKPPSMAVPEAYKRRAEIEKLLWGPRS